MTAQQLKNSILQMAVQGKLVPQDPNDEPASVLLERIRAEKEKLIKEKKIKKEKNPSVIFRGADNTPYEKIGDEVRSLADEVPFDIPDSWEWVRLGELFQHNTGKALNAANRTGQLKQYITTSNLYWDRFELNNLKEMHFSESEVEKCTVIKGDLLVCEGGDIGRAAIWPFDYPMCIQNHIHRLRAYVPICTRFFYYLFDLYKHAGWIGGKGIGIQGLSSNAIHSLLFPLPPLAEQYRIVDAIVTLQPYTDAYADVESTLDILNTAFPERLKKSILQEAVQGKLVPQDPSDEPAEALLERIRVEKQRLIKEGKIKKDKHESVIFRRDNSHYEKRGSEEACIDDELPFDIPSTWVWCRLRSLLTQASTGPFGSMLHKEDYTPSGVPLVNPANIINGYIINTRLKYVSPTTAQRLKSYSLYPGDVIIGRRGEMGRSAGVQPSQREWLCGTGCFFVTPCPALASEYLVFLLGSPYVKSVLMAKSVGTTMNNLNHSILGDILIPLPPFNEQLRIMKKYVEAITPLEA